MWTEGDIFNEAQQQRSHEDAYETGPRECMLLYVRRAGGVASR